MPMDFATQAEQIAHHVSALSGLVGPMIASADDNERLRKEVEIWKLEWNKAEREKRKVQGLLDAALKGDGKVQMVVSSHIGSTNRKGDVRSGLTRDSALRRTLHCCSD